MIDAAGLDKPRVPASCQVSTPRAIADLMIAVLRPSPKDRWLEPCVGRGALLRALSRAGIPREQIRGLDLDPTPLGYDGLGRVLRGVDFLRWSLETKERFSAIVANPPYVPLIRSDPQVISAARQVVGPAGSKVGRGANAWYAFLCASLRLLSKGGRMSFLLPASSEYADYAGNLRGRLGEMFRVVEVHRTQRPLFDTVKEGSVLLVCMGFGEGRGTYHRVVHSESAALVRALSPGKVQRPAVQPYTGDITHGVIASATTRFDSAFELAIGGVVGHASYFLLSESERTALGLPTRALKPVLSRARHLLGHAVTRREWEKLRESDQRIWLFSPTAAQKAHPRVRAYLRLPFDRGGCKRNAGKVSGRAEWWRPEMPTHIDGFLSGMSVLGPWIALSCMPRLSASNTLYVVRARSSLVRANRHAWALALLTSKVREQVRLRTRRYADGLHKLEPTDINSLVIPVPTNGKGAVRAYRAAVEALLGGDEKLSTGLADTWFGI